MQRLAKKRQPLRPIRERVAEQLQISGRTPAEIAHLAGLDKRTAKRAFDGQVCTLETYEALVGALGWEFDHAVMTPKLGADPLASLEMEIERERQEIAARERVAARWNAALRARAAGDGGGVRLAAAEGRAF